MIPAVQHSGKGKTIEPVKIPGFLREAGRDEEIEHRTFLGWQ